MSTNKEQKPYFKEWLEKLQQESWQLELLISGGAIFAILETINYLEKYNPFLNNAMKDDPNLITGSLVFSVVFLKAGILIFLLNLVIHVLVRSLWIGAIGLRYVSGDIDYEELNYSDKFKKYYRKKIGSFDNYIEKLEDFSSILFSYTFLLFFILISFLFTGIVFFTLNNILQEVLPNGNKFLALIKIILLFSFFVCAIIAAFDFVTLGRLKRIKNKKFSTFYLPIYRFFSTITLSFLWRPMMLNFLDQKYTKRLFILIIPYLFLLFNISASSYVMQGFYPNLLHNNIEYPEIIDEFSFTPNYYDEEIMSLSKNNREESIDLFSIPSKKVSGRLGEIFVRATKEDRLLVNKLDSTLTLFEEEGLTNQYFSDFMAGFRAGGKNIDQEHQIHKLKDSITDNQLFKHLRDSIIQSFDANKKVIFRQKTRQIKSILQSSILISIDDQEVKPNKMDCNFYFHPNAESKGLLCFFPLDSLTIGQHQLKIGKVKGVKASRSSNEIYLDTTYYTIPFIYEGQ